MTQVRILTCQTIVGLTQLVGCTSDVSAPDAIGPITGEEVYGFDANVMPLVTEACNCHQSTPNLMAPFSLKPGEAYANLVGVASKQLPSMQLVAPGKLNESYLWHKLNDTQLQVGGEGAIMPSNIPLNAEELRVFERWIASGATP